MRWEQDLSILVFQFWSVEIHFYNKENVNQLSEGIQGIMSPTYRTKKLEKELNHCHSTKNKINLADEYIRIGKYSEALELLNTCANDNSVDVKLIQAHYLNQNYQEVVSISNSLKGHKSFEKSEEKICFAWSLFRTQNTQKAQEIFAEMDDKYCNYPQRIEYCKFLIETEQKDFAESKLNRIRDEWDDMSRNEKRLYKGLDTEIRQLYKLLS